MKRRETYDALVKEMMDFDEETEGYMTNGVFDRY